MWQVAIEELRQRQEQFDADISGWRRDYSERGGHIHCRCGCRSCCNLAVNATFTEALTVARALDDRQRSALDAHVGRLLELREQMTNLKSYLKLHRQKVGFCPFLDDTGVCGVYSHRPFSCRALLSTRNEAWCGIDFATLHPLEKQAFLSSLDTEVVAFPSHYVAAIQETGRECEERTTDAMLRRFGVAVTGNMPFLAWLEKKYSLSSIIPHGAAAIVRLLAQEHLSHPLLIHVEA